MVLLGRASRARAPPSIFLWIYAWCPPMTSCSATSWSILRFRATYTLFTISESRAIFHANDTERQAQQVAENPRRQRVSGETPLENAHLNSSRVEKTTRSREALKQSEGNVKTATTNIYRGSDKILQLHCEWSPWREETLIADASKKRWGDQAKLAVYGNVYLLRCNDKQQQLHDLYIARQ